MPRIRFGRMQPAFSTCAVKTIPLLRTLIEKESELALKSVSSVPLGGISGRKLAHAPSSPNQAHAETQNCTREKQCADVGEIHQAIRLLRRRRSDRQKERERNENGGNRCAGSGQPLPKRRKHGLVHIAQHDQRQHQIDAGVSMTGAPKVVSQRIVHIPRRAFRQKTEKKKTSTHHARQKNEKNSTKHSPLPLPEFFPYQKTK